MQLDAKVLFIDQTHNSTVTCLKANQFPVFELGDTQCYTVTQTLLSRSEFTLLFGYIFGPKLAIMKTPSTDQVIFPYSK
jgi:hypothetical protein